MRGEIFCADLVFSFWSDFVEKFFGAIAGRDIVTDECARSRTLMAVKNFFTGRFDDVHVDIGAVGVPGHDDAQVGIENAKEFFINRRNDGRFGSPFLSFGPVCEFVKFLKGDECSPECVVSQKRRESGFMEVFESLLGVVRAQVFLCTHGECECQIAPGKGFIGTEFCDFTKDDEGEIELTGFAKAPGIDATDNE